MPKLSFTRSEELEKLAAQYAGDGKSELCFVSYDGMVVAAFSNAGAIDYAAFLDQTDPETPIIVEDKTGVCWGNDADDRAQKEEG